MARELGAALARSDLMVITGAGGGIMAAAHEGAGLTHSLGFNITLPFEQHANPTVAAPPICCPSTFSSRANCSSSRKPTRWCYAPVASARWMKHWKY
jgi:hypothetical protein